MSDSRRPGFAARAHRFLADGIWRVDEAARPRLQRAAIRVLRLAWSVGKGFEAHACSLHASALTYYTLFAIVPTLALALALARVFGGEEIARREIQRQLVQWVGELPATNAPAASPGRSDLSDPSDTADGDFARRVIALPDRIFDQINRLNLRTLGGIGLVGLLWMVIAMLRRVEASFNAVWGVAEGRSLWRSCTDYLSVVMIVPLLALAATTVPVADMLFRHAAVAGVSPGSLRTVVGSLLVKKAIVLLFATLAFSALLRFMPNTRVQVGPSLAGGLFTAAAFMVWLRLCTAMQIGIAKYSLLYGGLALLPILLAWVYVSWQIMLLGAELTASLQLGTLDPTERRGRPASPRSRLLLGVALCAAAGRAVREHGEPLDAEAYARQHRLPRRFVRRLLFELAEAGLLAEVAGRPGHFLPCREPDKLTVGDVARHVLDHGLSVAELGIHRLDAGVLAVDTDLEKSLFPPATSS
jgi:membrane protein